MEFQFEKKNDNIKKALISAQPHGNDIKNSFIHALIHFAAIKVNARRRIKYDFLFSAIYICIHIYTYIYIHSHIYIYQQTVLPLCIRVRTIGESYRISNLEWNRLTEC